MDSSYLEVTAFGGESFALGRLYDCRTQKVLIRSLWDDATIAKQTKKKENLHTDFKINVSNNFSERAEVFDVKGSVKLGVLCGLISLEGSGSYLTSSKTSKKTQSISLFLKMITRTESLSNDVIKVIDNSISEKATHVIVEITYGARAVFDFQYQDSQDEKSSELSGLLKGAIEKIPTVSISVHGEGKYTTEEKEKTKNMLCSFKGDINIETIPKTFEDAEKLFHGIPKLITENTDKAVPLFVKMIPLSEFDNKLEKIYREVKDVLIEQISDIFEKAEETKMRLNDILESLSFSHFPQLTKEYTKLKNYIGMGLNPLKKKLCNVLPKIRDGTKSDEDLKAILDDWNKSPVCFNKLDTLVSNLEKYIRTLEDLLKIMFENNSETNLKKQNSNEEQTISFIIFADNKTDKFLSELESYLDIEETKENYSTLVEFKEPKHALQMARDFRNFALANKHTKTTFAVYTERMSTEMDFDIKLLNNGKAESVFTFPQKVQNVKIQNVTFTSFDLSWEDDLNGDMIETYEVSISDDENKVPIKILKGHSNTMHVSDLEAGKNYTINICVLTKFGFSQKSISTIKTISFDDECAFSKFFKEINLNEIHELQDLNKIITELSMLKETKLSQQENSNKKELISHEIMTNGFFKKLLLKFVELYHCSYPHEQETAKIQIKIVLSPFTPKYYPKDISEVRKVFEILEPNCKETIIQNNPQPNSEKYEPLKNPASEKDNNFNVTNDKENKKDTKHDQNQTYLSDIRRSENILESKENIVSVGKKSANNSNKNVKIESSSADQSVFQEPQKQITKKDLLSIKLIFKDMSANNWEELQKVFLQKVFSHDQQARRLKFPKGSPYRSYSDLLISIMERCDDFVMQNLFEKLLDNQFSIPILCKLNGKHTFFLWALRTVKKSWNTYEKFISIHPLETISFCRVGSLQRFSKSVIINNIMSSSQGWEGGSFFLHRDIENESKLNRGSIDASFFCPDGRDGEKFTNINCIYNLRGDATEFPDQFKFLFEISSRVVILSEKQLTPEQKQKLPVDSLDEIIFVELNEDYDESEDQTKKETFITKVGDMNLSEICVDLVEILCKNLGRKDKELSIEEHSKFALKYGFCLDEETVLCKRGKTQAEIFWKVVDISEFNKRKETVVPLQGKPWKEWAQTDKEEVRLKDLNGQDPTIYGEEIIKRKIKHRADQQKIGISKAMEVFISELGKTQTNSELTFFLDWCQIFLNWTSQEQIHLLQQQYKTSKEKPSSEGGSSVEYELARISHQLFQLSFGLENILRELGQIYECGLSTSEAINLPKQMARMMINGYSLEIMDGDVSHVPVTWVKEVLKNLEEEVLKNLEEEVLKNLEEEVKSNTRIIVISVLGIQSCGKSTLLNEMFGCKFPVSAGRCTKGVFIQLVSVEKELSKKMKCDYFLIMDAEGLRSPNLSGEYYHDNEIATYVTFLSDLTLITFQGETLSTEMKEVLEIVVHAYARMKALHIKSFVHLTYLRVSGLNREEKNLAVEEKIINELDKIAMKIASDENRQDLIGGFSAVFQSLKITYPSLRFEKTQTFPSLWIGNMRVPESKFGQYSIEFRNSICTALMDQTEKSFKASELSFFITMLDHTWKAIKTEDFVLKFKNTKQIDSYTKLEKEYYRLKDEVWQKFLIQSSQAVQSKTNWLSFKSEEAALKKFTNSFEDKVDLNNNVKNVKVKLTDFTHTLEDPDYASGYILGFIGNLNSSINDWKSAKRLDIKSKIRLAYVEQNLPSSKDYKTHLKTKISQLAEGLRQKKGQDLVKGEIDKEFETWFQHELKKAEEKDKENGTIDSYDKVQDETFSMLEEELCVLKVSNKTTATAKNWSKEIKTDKKQLENLNSINPKDHQKKIKWYQNVIQYLVGEPSDFEMDQIKSKWRSSEKSISNLLEKETSTTYDNLNSPNIIKKIINTVKEEIKKFEQDNFIFTSEFKWDALVKYYCFSVKRIAIRLEESIKKASAVLNLKEMKESLHRDFVNDCIAANQSLRMGEKFSEHILMDAVIYHIQVSKGIEISDHLKQTPELSTKSVTTFKMLEEMLGVDTETLNTFFYDYKRYAEKWISEKVLASCLKSNYLQDWLIKQIGWCVKKITEKLNCSTNRALQSQMMLGTWYEAFVSDLMDAQDDTEKIDLKASKESFSVMVGTEVDIFSFVTETIRLINETSFQDLTYGTIVEKLNDSSTDHQWIQFLNWLEFKPLECLQDQLLGCTDQCPLCGAICDGGVVCKNEETRQPAHFTEIHLPSGISGWHGVDTKQLTSGICSVEICGQNRFRLSQTRRERFGIIHEVEEYIPYKDANEIFKGIWRITPDPTSEATRFWKFLFVKHQKRIAEIRGLKEADDIPVSWNKITREQALENLKEVKNQI